MTPWHATTRRCGRGWTGCGSCSRPGSTRCTNGARRRSRPCRPPAPAAAAWTRPPCGVASATTSGSAARHCAPCRTWPTPWCSWTTAGASSAGGRHKPRRPAQHRTFGIVLMAPARPRSAESSPMGKWSGRQEQCQAVGHRAAHRVNDHADSLPSWPPPAGPAHSPGASMAARPGPRARTLLSPALACALAALLPGPAFAAPATPPTLAWAAGGALAGVLATAGWIHLRQRRRERRHGLPDATAVLESLPCAAFLKDADGRYIAVNRHFEAHYGCSREQVLGRTLADVPQLHGADSEVLLQVERRLRQTGDPVACEIGHTGGDAPRTLRLRLQPLPGGQAKGVVLGTMADVTDLQEARRATEAATHTAGTFLSLVSHEIRTPIAGARGIVELMAHTPLDPEQVHMLGMLEESVEGLLEILGDILDFSRLQAGELRLDEGEVDLRAVFDELVAGMAALAGERGLRLHARVDHRLAAAYRGDPVRLRQVLAWLLSSAVRTTASGVLELQAEVLSGAQGVQRLRLAVAGNGVAASVSPAEGNMRPGGLALGLAICQHLVRLMHGELVLSQLDGDGALASLELELPVERALQPLPGLVGRVALACTIDPRTGRALSEALVALGLRVLETTPSSVFHLQAGDADLVLVDAPLVRAGRVPPGIPHICLHDPSDPLPPPEDCIVLPVAPLLWRNL